MVWPIGIFTTCTIYVEPLDDTKYSSINHMILRCHPLRISIINHTLPSTIRAVISTVACTSMASNSMSDSECYLVVRVHVYTLRVLLLP